MDLWIQSTFSHQLYDIILKLSSPSAPRSPSRSTSDPQPKHKAFVLPTSVSSKNVFLAAGKGLL